MDSRNEDRIENIRRVAEITKLFVETGHIVITAFISPFKENRIQAKKIISENDFLEVYVDSTLETCEKTGCQRSYTRKLGLARFKALQVFQVTFEAPVKPDIVVKTDEQTPDESIDYLFKQLKSKL